MVLLGMAMICSTWLSVYNYKPSSYLAPFNWPPFAMPVLTEVVSPSLGKEVVVGPMSSPVEVRTV